MGSQSQGERLSHRVFGTQFMIVYGVVPLYLYVYDGTQLCRYRRRVAEIFNNPDTSYTHYNRAFKDKQQLLIAEIIAAKMLFMTV